MRYELFYWPGIPGRGEFVRLALEAAAADYVDVAASAGDRKAGFDLVLRLMRDESVQCPPFAPPYLRAGELLIAQTANILQYLGPRLGLAPADEAGRLWAHQLQLTIMDAIAEVHQTHHPIATTLYYEDQKPEALRCARNFREHRLPRFLDYFESVIRRNPSSSGHLLGAELSYVDLSLFHLVSGLRYAFPLTLSELEARWPRLEALVSRVGEQPQLAGYLRSPRRPRFSEEGIFRRYPELDAQP